MNSPKQKKGFTLIELLISVSIFAIIVFISIGSVVLIFGTNRKSENIKNAVDNAAFAIDVMEREVRFGRGFTCDGDYDCEGGSTLSFTASDGRSITYKLEDQNIVKRVDSGSFLPLTAYKYSVNDLRFNLKGGSSNDNLQPFITIFVNGEAGAGTNEASNFDMQTSISSRQLD